MGVPPTAHTLYSCSSNCLLLTIAKEKEAYASPSSDVSNESPDTFEMDSESSLNIDEFLDDEDTEGGENVIRYSADTITTVDKHDAKEIFDKRNDDKKHIERRKRASGYEQSSFDTVEKEFFKIHHTDQRKEEIANKIPKLPQNLLDQLCLTQTDVTHLRNLFMTYDLGYDGEIDLIEFLKVIDAPSSPITRKAFRLMDTQQTGALNFVEFVSHVSGYATMSLEQIARFAFEVYTESTRMQQKDSHRQLSIRHIVRLINDTHDDSCTIESLSEKNIIDACRQCKFPHLIIEEYCTSIILTIIVSIQSQSTEMRQRNL